MTGGQAVGRLTYMDREVLTGLAWFFFIVGTLTISFVVGEVAGGPAGGTVFGAVTLITAAVCAIKARN